MLFRRKAGSFRDARGFTLVELIIVMVVLGIMAALAIPKFFSVSEDAKYSAVQGALGGVRSAIANYYAKEAARTGTAAWPTLVQLETAGTVVDGPVPPNPYCDGTNNGGVGDTCSTNAHKIDVIASTAAKGTAGCDGTTPVTNAGWCYNAATGEFWAATDDSDTTIAGRIKEHTM